MMRPHEPRILVVDDDPDICQNLTDILSDLGYQVDSAHNGPAALELGAGIPMTLRYWTSRCQVWTGSHSIARSRSSAGTVSVLITAYAQAATAEEAISAGTWKVLSKPVDFPKLLQLLDQALEQPLVLVVDDDRDLCANLWDLLRERGFRVSLAHDCAEAAAQLKESAFEVVLIDMHIPDRDGPAVFETVLAANPEARTVLITGFRSETDDEVARLTNAGADAVATSRSTSPSCSPPSSGSRRAAENVPERSGNERTRGSAPDRCSRDRGRPRCKRQTCATFSSSTSIASSPLERPAKPSSAFARDRSPQSSSIAGSPTRRPTSSCPSSRRPRLTPP